ncbi:MAG: hypothetical protein MUO29_03990, partial [Desulfobacterales bacterium]|nr:hypothetical protein [Desulfobacterales bacterium]
SFAKALTPFPSKPENISPQRHRDHREKQFWACREVPTNPKGSVRLGGAQENSFHTLCSDWTKSFHPTGISRLDESKILYLWDSPL